MPLNNSQIEESFSTADEDVKTLLFNILNLNLQNSSSENLIINAINKLLLVSKTRLQGLEYLNLIISNCSKTFISENAFTWISHCLIKYDGDNLKELKLFTVGKIVESSYGDQEFTKRFVADYISKVFESCISTHVSSHETEAALETLTICMRRYASWFAPHKSKIENFIITFLEHSSDKLVERAAVAFLYLQQVGGAGVDGINHKTNFSKNFEKLCATTQKLFDDFFENETEIYDTNKSNQDGFNFIDLSLHSQKMLHVTSKRIANCLQFLRTMLQKSFPVAKDIKPMEVLDIISRGTAIHHCLTMDNEKSLEDFQFSLLLNKIQVQLLHLLRILILWLEANALPFSYTISKILIDCLKKSQNCQCFTTDSLYQEVVYKILGCWIRISKNSFHPHFQTQLITCIMKDITPIKDQVTLSLQSDIPKSKSLKARNKFIKERIISSGQGSSTLEKLTTVEKLNNERKCVLALDTLKQLQTATSLRLKPNVLQNLYTTIMSPVLEMQTSKFSHPYTNRDCQAKLYENLVAFYEQDTLRVLPPLQLTLTILNSGVNNSNRHIALTCEHGLSILEKLCQPVCPSLFSSEATSKDTIKKPETIFSNQVFDEMFEDSITENGESQKNVPINSDSLKQDVEPSEAVKEADLENGGETCDETVEETNLDIDSEKDQVEMQKETTVSETQIYQEDVKEANVPPETLLKEKSIHIIDVQVIKTSADYDEYDTSDSVSNIPIPVEVKDELEVNVSQNSDDFSTEIDILKEDILTNTSIKVSNTEIELDQSKSPTQESVVDESKKAEDEPPLKKSRIEGETKDIAEVEQIKDELEEVDDTFEEDDAFVDEIKEY